MAMAEIPRDLSPLHMACAVQALNSFISRDARLRETNKIKKNLKDRGATYNRCSKRCVSTVLALCTEYHFLQLMIINHRIYVLSVLAASFGLEFLRNKRNIVSKVAG